MIAEKTYEMNVHDLLKEINEKLSRFQRIILDNRNKKDEKSMSAEMLMYTPEEWETISLTIIHYQLFMQSVREKNGNEEELKSFLVSNVRFLGYLRDIVSSLYSRLPQTGEGKAKA